MIASAFEVQGFQETLKCHCLGFLSFPLPSWLPLSSWVEASYVPVSVCISRVSHFWQDWHQRIINLNFAAKFIHFHPFILCSPIRVLRVIMINREIILFQNHPEQFLISQIIDCSIFHFREIVKRCGTFASNIYPYHFLMGIDDAKHGLEL